MSVIEIHTSRPYSIRIENGVLKSCGEAILGVHRPCRVCIVTDDQVGLLYADAVSDSLEKAGFQTCTFTFPHGETSKSHETLLNLYAFLCEHSLTRSDLILALGGGVVGDLAGYAAATYLRGVSFVQMPTSLLAQIDSSVGGKTAVNIPQGKNLVGAFWQPILVLCDSDTLRTLPQDFFDDGMGEVVKYAAIRSPSMLEDILSGQARKHLSPIIAECIDIKRSIVEADELDTGERMLLNFGHTLGHAIEKVYGYGVYSHGKAVAMGMAMMTQASERMGFTRPGTLDKLLRSLDACGLPHHPDTDWQSLYEASLNDKKRDSDTIRIVLLRDIGEAEIVALSLPEYRSMLKSAFD